MHIPFITRLQVSATSLLLCVLIGCTDKSDTQDTKSETIEDRESKIDIQIETLNKRRKALTQRFDSTKFQIVGCKSLYDDNMQQYIQATVVNRTNKTVKGIHAYMDDNPDGFLAYKVIIKPHSSAKIRTKYFLCNYRLSGVVLNSGELLELANPSEETENGTVLNSPYMFQQPILVEDE